MEQKANKQDTTETDKRKEKRPKLLMTPKHY